MLHIGNSCNGEVVTSRDPAGRAIVRLLVWLKDVKVLPYGSMGSEGIPKNMRWRFLAKGEQNLWKEIAGWRWLPGKTGTARSIIYELEIALHRNSANSFPLPSRILM